MLMVGLALRDLWRDRVFFLCNLAVMVGVLVPLLVLFGVKNGVYQALEGQLLANPATLQIDTQGNAALTEAEIAPLRAWPEVAFLVPRSRSQFDYVNLQPAGGGRLMREALLLPTGAGDPNLPPGLVLGPEEVALSDLVARQMQIGAGDEVVLVTQAEGRPHQLRLTRKVRLVLPAATVSGRSILAPYPVLDLVEAFYDAYALPDYGVPEGRDLALRVPRYEGLRIYARDLTQLGALQARVGQSLGLATASRAREVEAVLGLGRNLDLAMALTASLAALGLGAALVFAFWSDVTRKRPTLAALAILGLEARQLALLPLVQAGVTAASGLVLSFAVYGLAALGAERLFGAGLPAGARIASIGAGQALAIAAGVLGLGLASALAAARAALQSDPAAVLREGR